MTTTAYKGYTIVNVGISRYIYRPGRITKKGIGKLPPSLILPLAENEWLTIDPLKELAAMVGEDKITAVVL